MQEYLFNNEIYYRTNEFKSGRATLVFVHGLSGSSSAWLPYEKIFENKYNLLSFDIRGHGKSKKFPKYADYEIKNFAEDLEALVSYLNIKKFVLISHSFASLIGAEYIKLYQENISAAVFLSPIFDLEKTFLSKIGRFILGLSKIFDWLPFVPQSGSHIDYAKFPNSTDWSLKRCYADVSNTTLRAYSYCLKHSLRPEQEYFLEKIKVPTLIVHGVKDTMSPAKNSIAISKKITNSKLVLFDNADHIVVLNNIKEVSDAIESFIENKNLLE